MGYFSNGTEGMEYQTEYCDKCAHMHPEHGCPCDDAHELWNYEECNKKDSILHKMIPRNKDARNEKCIFFAEWETPKEDRCERCGLPIIPKRLCEYCIQ